MIRCIISLLLLLLTLLLSHTDSKKFDFRHKRMDSSNASEPTSFIIPGGEGSASDRWSIWSAPSNCSRPCGGGVAYQERTCLQLDGSSNCSGGTRKYFSCNTQECPENQQDFRRQQCSEFDEIPFEGQLYQWVPYTQALNKCELHCMPISEDFNYLHRPKVIDGTRCNNVSNDVCVDGACQPVGCDMMLGSQLVEDKCRVCGGDGSTCETFKDALTAHNLELNHKNLLTIPKGAMNVVINATVESNYYLAIRNRTGFFHIYGVFWNELPRTVTFAGCNWVYERSSPNLTAPDRLTCLGPTTEPVELVLLSHNVTADVNYEYTLDTYLWITAPFESCSFRCGGGEQSRNVTCTSKSTQQVVDDALCDASEKPITMQTCAEHACPFRWVTGPWINCSKTCGTDGKQTREVYCELISTEGEANRTEDAVCLERYADKPAESRERELEPCEYSWFMSRWTKCSAVCGKGVQTRTVVCSVNDGVSLNQKDDDSNCAHTEKPEKERKCDGPSECPGQWFAGPWTDCYKICGGVLRSRKVFCIVNNTAVAEQNCNVDNILFMSEPCNAPAYTQADEDELCTKKGDKFAIISSSTADFTFETGEENTTDWSTNTEGLTTAEYETESTTALDETTERTETSFEPCSKEPYGCCRDGKTPAHGHNREGCCLQSPYGCCPDNVVPAQGPNQEGCECEYSPYGCCPDNKTSARGYGNAGCGCQYTEHGCCPDKETEAQGPNYEGCPCHAYQFGCCPDGATPAKGPHNQGCHCSHSEFKCCSDGQTAAKGPDGEGCTCAESKYGCCPDGSTEAQGYQFEGCTDAPTSLQKACTLMKDKGPCTNFTIKYFFDIESGYCGRFLYGGCGGNDNRFESVDDCQAVCEAPPGKDVCYLPKITGPCTGQHSMWYYDAERNLCSQFTYGGCLGNANRFEKLEDCKALCSVDDTKPPYEQPMEHGPCNGTFERWFYDKETDACQPFYYGGCKGNRNNYQSEASCNYRSKKKEVRKPSCSQPPEVGSCEAQQARWYFAGDSNKCMPFYFTGCGGNENNYVTREQCEAQCPSIVEKDICHLPAMIGKCKNFKSHWYFDTKDNRCREFYYGGCGGNGNNFVDELSCVNRCIGGAKSAPLKLAIPILPEQVGFLKLAMHFPQGHSLLPKSNFTVVCLVDGYPTPTVQWLKDDEILNPTERIHITGENLLVVTGALPSDSGRYNEPAVTDPAVLKEGEEVEEEFDIKSKEGGVATLPCIASGYRPSSIRWRKGLTMLNTNQGRYVLTSTGDLLIEQLRRTDSGRYVCIADNGVSEPALREVQLTANVPVKVALDFPQGQYTLPNSNFTINCTVDGYLKPTVYWFMNGMLLRTNKRIHITDENLKIITGALPFDTGFYKCLARNEHTEAFQEGYLSRIIIEEDESVP
ncbi:papilin-like [Anopheles aquasalis]|uniref:papilin-like n=1 Tax=Anopheles aquasalis TaxID=42839 RepID=UPI00215A3533|nr:papilin-like [Anopheles aquasalis]